MKPVAYEGSEPYIFVSYAHRDGERVFEVLDELDQRGYRLWYDDGIAPGSEWPEDIAQHLDGAALVMAFVTNNSMASRNCRREINFSLSREKPFLSVVLEPTEMPLGMEMQLSAQQSIIRYNYDSWDAFMNKVLLCPDLAPCKRSAEAALSNPEPAPNQSEAALAPAAQPVAEPSLEQPETTPTQLPAQPVEAEVTVIASETPELPETPAEDSHPHRARKRLAAKAESPTSAPKPAPRLILIAVAAVVLLCAALVLPRLLAGPKTIATSWGSEIATDSTSVFATGKTLTAADWETLRALSTLRTIRLEDCDLSACDFAAAVADGAFPELSKLDISGSTGVSDYSFLSKLTLTELDLAGCADFADLALLDTTKLTTLDVSGTAVTDLAPLAEAQLTSLSFADTAVSDSTPLASMTSLSAVDGSRTQVSSLKPLADLEQLDSIAFNGCTLRSLPQSLAALSLSKVHLAGAGVLNPNMLVNCTRLTELDLSMNKRLSDLSWLDAQNYETLTSLNLAQTEVAAKDLAWIAQCPNLQTLSLDGLALTDLAFCGGLENLETLSAVGCGITDISALSGCTKLEVAILACNKIDDASPLGSMSLSRDTIVDLTNNALTSVDGLAAGEYRAIMLYGNDPDIALTVPKTLNSYVTVIPWCETIEKSPMVTDGYQGKVFIVDCPENQQLKTDDLFKGVSLTFVTADELWDLYANNDFGYMLDVDYGYFLSVVRGEDGFTYTSVWG